MLEKVRQKIVFKAVYPLREPKVCIDYDKLPDKSYALKVDIPSDATKDLEICILNLLYLKDCFIVLKD